MACPIPIALNPGPLAPARAIEVDAVLVAPGLGLDVAAFQRLMGQRRISQLCERGTGEDAGLYRVTFYYGGRRVRIIIDGDGRQTVD